jgi:hypothetical protein
VLPDALEDAVVSGAAMPAGPEHLGALGAQIPIAMRDARRERRASDPDIAVAADTSRRPTLGHLSYAV